MKMTSSTKPEVHNVLYCSQEDRVTVTCGMYSKFGEIRMCRFEICQRTGRPTEKQTDKQTGMLIAILCSRSVGEMLIITKRIAVYLETHCNIGSKRAFTTGVFDR